MAACGPAHLRPTVHRAEAQWACGGGGHRWAVCRVFPEAGEPLAADPTWSHVETGRPGWSRALGFGGLRADVGVQVLQVGKVGGMSRGRLGPRPGGPWGGRAGTGVSPDQTPALQTRALDPALSPPARAGTLCPAAQASYKPDDGSGPVGDS